MRELRLADEENRFDVGEFVIELADGFFVIKIGGISEAAQKVFCPDSLAKMDGQFFKMRHFDRRAIGKNLPKPVKSLFERKQRFFLRIDPDGDHDFFKKRQRPFDQIDMADGNRVERTRENSNFFHQKRVVCGGEGCQSIFVGKATGREVFDRLFCFQNQSTMKKWLLLLSGFAGCWLPAGAVVFPIQLVENQAVVADFQADSTVFFPNEKESKRPDSIAKKAKKATRQSGFHGLVAFVWGIVFWTSFMAMFVAASQMLVFLMVGSLLLGIAALKTGLRKQTEPEWRASLFGFILLILPATFLWFLMVPAVTGLLMLIGYATDTFLAPILLLALVFFLAHRAYKKKRKFSLFMWLPNLLRDFGEARRAFRTRKTSVKTGG